MSMYRSVMPIPLGAVLIDTEYNQLGVLLSSGMSDDLMFKTVEKDWMVLL